MPVLSSEAVVLRTWPLREADLIVSLFTRDYGRLKGVAKSALKSRRRFGGALEPMTLVRAFFAERPGQELLRLDQLEILASPLSRPVDATRLAVLSFYAELIDEVLPERDPQDAVFRLLVSVLEHTNREKPWMPLTYFSLWMTRLMGLLPDLSRCILCQEVLSTQTVGALKGHGFDPAPSLPRGAENDGLTVGALAPEGSSARPHAVFWNPFADGLLCVLHRGTSATPLSADSFDLAQRMLRQPASAFASEAWTRRRAQDLRRFTLQTLERHLERKLRSADALARLGG
jgi:DNA repair protein RecO (recombination protein O)